MDAKLFLIGTPLGNLSDITQRAVETLRALDVLYCEDTRVTAKLLAHIGARPTLRSLSDDAPEQRWSDAVAEAQGGKRVGFCTDAGMPGVSDPGRKLVRAAWAAGLAPSVVPGPSSVGTLLAACPFVDNSFRFAGFPPRKAGERMAWVAGLAQSAEPCFFFDAPSRVHAVLDEICAAVEPQRQLLIGREMTKLYEQFTLFTAEQWPQLREGIPAKGEFTLAVAARPVADAPSLDAQQAQAALTRLERAGFSKRDAVKALAAVWDAPLNDVKRLGYGGADPRGESPVLPG
jgi:16S rRNA (cytidine1402-2'-O)-methyltransferase